MRILNEKQLEALKLGRQKGVNRSRPKGLVYTKHKENPTSFKKGMTPWNKDKKLHYSVWNMGIKGIHLSPNTEFKKGQTKGKKNVFWKGNKVGYYALHAWLRREYGIPDICEFCNSTKKIQWASKDYSYSRNRDSWLKLCFNCHRKYDSQNGWGLASQQFTEIRKDICAFS